jgi:regulator of cell morphogenesis and NO signaling
MQEITLSAALEREHRQIDEEIAAFTAGPDGGTEHLTRAMEALRRHIYLEEQFLFPPLREAGLMAPIFVMLREHGQMWTTMAALDADLAAGAAVAEGCRELSAQLEAHNSKEEPIIYPQADTVLAGTAADELRALMASGHTPDGWVCSGARS